MQEPTEKPPSSLQYFCMKHWDTQGVWWHAFLPQLRIPVLKSNSLNDGLKLK